MPYLKNNLSAVISYLSPVERDPLEFFLIGAFFIKLVLRNIFSKNFHRGDTHWRFYKCLVLKGLYRDWRAENHNR